MGKYYIMYPKNSKYKMPNGTQQYTQACTNLFGYTATNHLQNIFRKRAKETGESEREREDEMKGKMQSKLKQQRKNATYVERK